jgi:hypothetical protein
VISWPFLASRRGVAVSLHPWMRRPFSCRNGPISSLVVRIPALHLFVGRVWARAHAGVMAPPQRPDYLRPTDACAPPGSFGYQLRSHACPTLNGESRLPFRRRVGEKQPIDERVRSGSNAGALPEIAKHPGTGAECAFDQRVHCTQWVGSAAGLLQREAQLRWKMFLRLDPGGGLPTTDAELRPRSARRQAGPTRLPAAGCLAPPADGCGAAWPAPP